MSYSSLRQRQHDRRIVFRAVILALAVIGVAVAASRLAKSAEDVRPELRFGTPTAVEHFKAGYIMGPCLGHYTLWVGEYLDEDKLANPIPRKGFPFHPDSDVPSEFRVTPDDYKGSGFDRGHLANFADNAWSKEAAADSMSMANMTPQSKQLNEGHTKWEGLESWTRDLARKNHAKVWVFTGPAFLPNEDGDVVIHTLSEHVVWIPSHTWKVVYAEYPSGRRLMRGYLMPNTDDPPDFTDCRVSVDSLEAAVGLDFFRNLPDDVEDDLESKQ